MLRRIRTTALYPGLNKLPQDQAHHIRDVLRMKPGEALELFTDEGHCAHAVIRVADSQGVQVEVGEVVLSTSSSVKLTIVAAVPKANRADWMVEKLSELGTDRFIPLITQRSVVVPQGVNKIERWRRLAIESAKQCRRAGTMAIEAPAKLDEALAQFQAGRLVDGSAAIRGIYLSTTPNAVSIDDLLRDTGARRVSLAAWIGPEGGWTEDEMVRMERFGLTGAGLSSTILRVETAAVAVAAIFGCMNRTEKAGIES